MDAACFVTSLPGEIIACLDAAANAMNCTYSILTKPNQNDIWRIQPVIVIKDATHENQVGAGEAFVQKFNTALQAELYREVLHFRYYPRVEHTPHHAFVIDITKR